MSVPDPLPAVAALAFRTVAELVEAGASPRPLTASAEGAGWTVTVVVTPTRAVEARTPCERDVLALLSAADRPWTTSRVLGELESRGMVHGASTVRRTLTRLARAGVLAASRRHPRGYFPAPNVPGPP